jgi:hypothetical protein
MTRLIAKSASSFIEEICVLTHSADQGIGLSYDPIWKEILPTNLYSDSTPIARYNESNHQISFKQL